MVANKPHGGTGERGSLFMDITDIFGDLKGQVFSGDCRLTTTGNKTVAACTRNRNAATKLAPAELQKAGSCK
jgi:hypothetical protein